MKDDALKETASREAPEAKSRASGSVSTVSPDKPDNSAEAASDRNVGNGQAGTGFWSVTQSVLAAGIGVQSKANKERDFQQGKPIHFIIGGIVGTVLFVLAVALFVRFLIASS